MVPQTRQLILFTLLLLTTALFAGDWYVSYRLHSHNFVIHSERLQVSKAMVPFQGESQPVCTFLTEAENFASFAKTQSQPLLECLMAHGVLVHSREKITDLVHHNASLELVLPPVPLKVDFNDGLVIINKVIRH
ncbi:hypothetical protein [Hydrogenimonas sp.]